MFTIITRNERNILKPILTHVVSFAFILVAASTAMATQVDIPGPSGSGTFGGNVTVLPNGNFVVVDRFFDLSGPTVTDVGAVYLYNGATLALISTLTGSTANNQVGSGGITVLSNGNFIVRSPSWDNPSPLLFNVGAVTWCSAAAGCNGIVSATNSLIGGSLGDSVGETGVIALANGNYVVSSRLWDDPSLAVSDVGAVTWGNGTSGTAGLVSASNSLIGSTANDQVGVTGVVALSNGNYVVRSNNWDDPLTSTTDVGAVTWGNGATGTVGAVSASNSLVGSSASDQVGGGGITALTNGNYVVRSENWDNPSTLTSEAGAVTWGNGTTGTVGAVTASNSLIGGTAGDQVGVSGVTALTNGNYVVSSHTWDNPSTSTTDVGAVTWGNGTSGTAGIVSATNSLIGGTFGDQVGVGGSTALTNGNYVVSSYKWDNPSTSTIDVGAVTWGNGTTGTVGVVTATNSVIGGTADDFVGTGVTALTNGNYVVSSDGWDNPLTSTPNVGAVSWVNGAGGVAGLVNGANSLIGGTAEDRVGGSGVTALTNGNYVVRSDGWNNPSPSTADVGAVTWGNGAGGTAGFVTAANSLIGGTAGDQVGAFGIVVLTNGNYVVRSSVWDNPSPLIADVGAVTWGDGAVGTAGLVTAANSLIGGTASDLVGSTGVTILTNGNYVVRSSVWNNPSPSIADVGAVTWGNGAGGTAGLVTAANSLIGGSVSDLVGGTGVTALSNGNYVVSSSNWDDPTPSIFNAGAVTFGRGTGGTNGSITSANSVLGTVTSGISTFSFDALRNRIVVGRGPSNVVSILFFETTASSDGAFSNAAIWDNGLPDSFTNAVIPNGRTVTLDSIANVGLVLVGCTGAIAGASSTQFINGTVHKDYCAASNETFTYPIGDSANYSPVTVTNLNGTGSFSAKVTDALLPDLRPDQSASRFWSLSGNGITTDLSFTYVDGDINGLEASYKMYKRSGGVTTAVNPFTINPATNTITATGISSFSDWAAGNLLAPTAANASISGRVRTANGLGIANVAIQITNLATGETRFTRSSAFGRFGFADLRSGETYLLSASSKRYAFSAPSRIIALSDDVTDADFEEDPK